MASPAQPSSAIRFGEFELNAANGELRKAGLPLKIHPQPFRVLLLLTERAGQVVTRQELQRHIWGNNTFVDFEGGINFCVRQVRDTLGDDADKPRYIETIPRRGYRFIAPVSHTNLREHVISFPLAPAPGDPEHPSAKPATESLSSRDIHAVPSAALPALQTPWNSKLVRAAIITLFSVALLSTGAFFYFHRSPKLTEKDTVVLADFSNSTGDPVFDDALKQALTVELGQSPFLHLLPDKKTNETLRMMGHAAGDRVTPDVGREICLRTGSKALLVGAISSIGSLYVVDLTAVACSTGDILAKEQAEAVRKEDVLKALSRAASSFRAKLGESLPSVQKFDVPIQATTTSLEALQNYNMAARVGAVEGDAASMPFVERALEYDPNFAMAYAALARRYNNLDQPSLALANATKAYQLRDRVTEPEKLAISAAYFRARGDLESLDQTLEVWKANYPHQAGPHGRLCVNYGFIGQFEKALAECLEAAQLDPDDAINVANLAGTYLNLNRFEESRRTCNQSLSRKLPCPALYYLAFLRGDSAEMAEQVSSVTGIPGIEDSLLSAQSDSEAYFGRVHQARDFSRRAVDSAVRAGLPETAALWQVKAALREAEFGHVREAKQGVEEALKLAPGRDVKVLGAIALARIGETAQTRELIKQLEQSYPSNTLLKIYWLPVINAAIELREGSSSKALASLEQAAPYDLAQPSPNDTGTLYPVYLRGQAYLLARNGPAAAAEFQKVLDHPGIVANFCTGALAHLQLARAQALTGNTAQAKNSYQDFLTLWKDADPNIPLHLAAKSESARLP